MDSLTQLTLGAAVGEVVLGRKVGNRAMLWGAIAGTIPDLDVFVGMPMNDLDALSFHRGPSHSIVFAIVFSVLMAGYTHWFYRNRHHQKKGFKIAGFATALGFLGLVLYIINMLIGRLFSTKVLIGAASITAVIGVYLLYRLWVNYVSRESIDFDVSWKSWYWLFFWAIVTHPILDCFTVYGTRLLWPFTDHRFAISNISVVDPLYTLPFLALLITASFFSRNNPKRAWINGAGLTVSSLYMIFTLINQQRVEKIFHASLEAQGITYSRSMVSPTILNNVLWHNVAESDSFYYEGLYSFFDKEQTVDVQAIPKNRDLIEGKENDRTIKTLRWFSDDYYSLLRREDGLLQLNDMRYGTFRGQWDSEKGYIFYFILEEQPDGSLVMQETDPGPPEGEAEGMVSALWKRMMGNKEV